MARLSILLRSVRIAPSKPVERVNRVHELSGLTLAGLFADAAQDAHQNRAHPGKPLGLVQGDVAKERHDKVKRHGGAIFGWLFRHSRSPIAVRTTMVADAGGATSASGKGTAA